jgi:hypothetical protein
MKMYYVEIDCVEPITCIPKKYEQTRIVLINACDVNGNLEYRLNHENKEYLVATAEYFGFQDAREFITEVDCGDEADQFIMGN